MAVYGGRGGAELAGDILGAQMARHHLQALALPRCQPLVTQLMRHTLKQPRSQPSGEWWPIMRSLSNGESQFLAAD